MPSSIRPRHVQGDQGTQVRWRDILTRWDDVVLDLHEHFGADWDNPDMDRPWPWWRDRIRGLLSVAPIVGAGEVLPGTRLGRALSPG